MNVFISYARRDQTAATQLRADIEQLGHRTWFDRDVTGGHQWWSTILRQIQGCGVFVFVLSPDSVKSRACLAELNYAEALRRPILPIMVRQTNLATAPPVIANTQIVDYLHRTTETVFGLLKGFQWLPPAGPLPMPPPPEPEIPTSYLNAYLERLEEPELSFTAQTELFIQLRARLGEEEDQSTIWELLVRLRSRADLAQSLVAELDQVLAPSWRPDPQHRFEMRFWDGHGWTTRIRHEGREFDEALPQMPTPPPPQAVAAPPPPPVPTKKSALPWILVGAAAVLAIAVVTIVLVTTGGGSSSSASPQSVAQRFVDAANARDGATLATLTCSKDQATVREIEQIPPDATLALLSVSAGASSGTATITLTTSGQTTQNDLPLIIENGEWKICSAE